MPERREFLKKLVKSTAYVAPVIYTLSAPRQLGAVVTSGMIMWMNTQQSVQGADDLGTQAPWSVAPQTTAPWETAPPWSAPPPGTPKPPGGGE